MANTSYIVFEKNGDAYYVLDNGVQAPTPEKAMEIVADKIARENGRAAEPTVYAAAPVRNWKQLPVGVEVITKVKVG